MMEIELRGLCPLIEVFNVRRSLAFYRDVLRYKGIELEPPFDTSYGMRQLYFSDPDDHAICLQFSSAAAAE